jgi:hypothetical protein
MFDIQPMPRHWGPAHDGEPGRWGVIGPRVGEDVFLHSRTPWCPRQSTTALFPRGGLKLHGAATRNIHERGLTETKWADQPIGVGAVKRYTSDYNLSRINVRSSAHAVPTLRGSQRETGKRNGRPERGGHVPDQAAASLVRDKRLRSLGSRMALRRRMDFGVISTSSSSPI